MSIQIFGFLFIFRAFSHPAAQKHASKDKVEIFVNNLQFVNYPL